MNKAPNIKILEFTVPQEKSGERLDKFLSELNPTSSRSYLQKLIKSGETEINGKVCKIPKTELKNGEKITLYLPEEKRSVDKILPETSDLKKIYEDNEILVIDKPAGMAVHPAPGTLSGTVVNALLGIYSDFAEKMQDNERPGIVHRLDKDTSGCLIIAKTPSAKFAISKQFADRKIEKKYLAITCGIPSQRHETIKTFIGRHPVDRKKMAVLKDAGREAISEYKVLATTEIEGQKLALLEVNLKTGRTHQIRVHLAHIKCPILGDPIYGGYQKIKTPRLMLHAWKISFLHPVSSEKISFQSPPPQEFEKIIGGLESLSK